ncbi:MAG: zf-HC2 domain-containing protein [Chloroflexi bacterium]|nr:zf-HC2 domain-containing protein [Chloroflexota bacterium]
MQCDDLLNYLSDYIDNDLDEALSAEARAHLATCPNCKVVLDTTMQTIALTRDREKRVIPAARRQQLFDQLQDAFLNQPDKTM